MLADPSAQVGCMLCANANLQAAEGVGGGLTRWPRTVDLGICSQQLLCFMGNYAFGKNLFFFSPRRKHIRFGQGLTTPSKKLFRVWGVETEQVQMADLWWIKEDHSNRTHPQERVHLQSKRLCTSLLTSPVGEVIFPSSESGTLLPKADLLTFWFLFFCLVLVIAPKG